MADLLYDVIRVVDTKENMSSTLKSKMLGFTSDTNEIAFKDAAGDMYYYKNYNDIDDLINRTGSQYWIVPVKSEIDLTSEEPASPVKGDRYINTATGTSSETSQEVAEDYVYTWSGSEWTETAPIEGMIVLNKNEESIKSYLSSTWVAVYAHTLSEVLTAGNDAGGNDILNLGNLYFSNSAPFNIIKAEDGKDLIIGSDETFSGNYCYIRSNGSAFLRGDNNNTLGELKLSESINLLYTDKDTGNDRMSLFLTTDASNNAFIQLITKQSDGFTTGGSIVIGDDNSIELNGNLLTTGTVKFTGISEDATAPKMLYYDNANGLVTYGDASNINEVLTAGNDAGGNDILNLGSITATDTVKFTGLSSGTGRLLTQNSSNGELLFNNNLQTVNYGLQYDITLTDYIYQWLINNDQIYLKNENTTDETTKDLILRHDYIRGESVWPAIGSPDKFYIGWAGSEGTAIYAESNGASADKRMIDIKPSGMVLDTCAADGTSGGEQKINGNLLQIEDRYGSGGVGKSDKIKFTNTTEGIKQLLFNRDGINFTGTFKTAQALNGSALADYGDTFMFENEGRAIGFIDYFNASDDYSHWYFLNGELKHYKYDYPARSLTQVTIKSGGVDGGFSSMANGAQNKWEITTNYCRGYAVNDSGDMISEYRIKDNEFYSNSGGNTVEGAAPFSFINFGKTYLKGLSNGAVEMPNLNSGTGRLLTQESSDGELQYNDNLSYDGEILLNQVDNDNSRITSQSNSDGSNGASLFAQSYDADGESNRSYGLLIAYNNQFTGSKLGIDEQNAAILRLYSENNKPCALGTYSNSDLILSTDNTKQMTIKSGGAVQMHNLSSGTGRLLLQDASTKELQYNDNLTYDGTFVRNEVNSDASASSTTTNIIYDADGVSNRNYVQMRAYNNASTGNLLGIDNQNAVLLQGDTSGGDMAVGTSSPTNLILSTDNTKQVTIKSGGAVEMHNLSSGLPSGKTKDGSLAITTDGEIYIE